ncbi:hypothetical protein [Streptomyces sp. NPDC051636]|uniref:hypothetical protein n=1 Tax=Streptomyces sp. NPDC051636 TaxID=3365663 RepID=UPI0037950A5B
MTVGPRQEQSWKPEGGEPSATAPARSRRLNRWLVEGLHEDLADLYAESHATAPSDPYRGPSRQNFPNRLATDMRRPRFAMVIAETDSLRGCAFGFPVHGDGSWWLGLDAPLPRSIEQLTVSGGVFVLADILIRPHPQDRGLAGRLRERLLTGHQASLGATLVAEAERQALAALRSWGWLDSGELRRPTGPTTFRALVLPLGVRTAARLEGLVTMPGGGGPGGA